MRTLLASVVLAVASVPAAASAVSINFDETSAPCGFAVQVPLTSQYSGQGVTFSGGWEVLNQCGSFGVSGHSVPNFLAWNSGAGTGTTQTLTFSSDASGLSFRMASSGGGTASITARNAAGATIQTVSRSLSSSIQTATITVPGVRSVVISVPSGDGVLDDLVFTLNNPPTANAGGPYTIAQGASLTLNGSGSSDSDGSIVNYEWDCTANGSYDVSSASPTGSACTYPDDGSYTVRLRVTDDDGGQATATAAVTATNTLPTANAGGPYTVNQGLSLALDGSGSADPDGAIALYEWDCTNNGSYDTSSASPTASSCVYPDDGSYTVGLRVTDDDGGQATATATVTVTNTAPAADAGGPYTVNQGVPLDVDGSGSADPDGTLVLYEWDCTNDGSYDVSSAAPIVGNACTYPDDGTFTLGLRVTDDDGATATDTATVTATNTAPTANAGGPYTGTKNVALALDGSSSFDPDGTLTTWEWDCTTDGSYDVTTASATGGTCSYGAVGTYTVTLRVTDDDGATATDTASVTVGNDPPIADAGGPYSGDETVAVAVDGSGSSDPGGALVTWAWDCDNDGSFELSGPTATASCTYAASGTYTVALQVTDDDGATATDTATVTIANGAPVLSGLTVPSGDEGASLSFSVTATDVPGDTVTVTWDFGDGTTGSGATPTHTYADDGVYTVVVTADDGDDTSTATGTATIANVDPVLSSTPPVNALEGTAYTYTPTVVDPGDEVFTYSLSLSAPVGMTIDPSTGAIAWTPTYDQSLVGSFSVVLTVDDGDGGQDQQSWAISVLSLDTDGDGLPDSWESANSLDPLDPNDGNADPDADGLTNLDEFGQGTDPNVYDGPSTPTPFSPLTGDEVSTDRPDLVADNAVDPQNDVLLYDFEVYEDAALTVPFTSASGVLETSVQTLWKVDQAMTENTTYWWRVRASDPFVSSPWSAAESFFVNTANEAPTVPSLSYPTGGETVATTTPETAWLEATDVDGDLLTYDVEVVDALGGLVASATGVAGDGTEGRWTVTTTLTEDEVYSWTARAVDEHGLAGDWAPEESFLLSTDNAAPFGTVFLAPEDGAALATLSPILVASESVDPEGGPLSYEFEIDLLPSFDSADREEATLPGTGAGEVAWDLGADGITLADNSWVYARVRAVDEGGVASVPDTISFFVRGENDAPTVPVLLLPEDDGVGGGSPVFEVEDPTDPEGDVVFVEFLVARDVELTEVLASSAGDVVVAGDGRTTWEPTASLSGTVHWTARAIDEGGAASEWATPFTYTVEGGATGDDDDDDDDGDGSGCDCGASVGGAGAHPGWLLMLLLVPAMRRRRS